MNHDKNSQSSEYQRGFSACEAQVRSALGGHPSSELWGPEGLLAATMRCVEELDRVEEERVKSRENSDPSMEM